MKKLDNIVVESLNREHGEQIIKTFNDLEINTMSREGFCCKRDGNTNRYYGLIDGVFSNYTMSSVRDYKCKIITLEQLKAMKEDKSEYPKLMIVSDKEINESNKGLKRIVIGFCKNSYWAINHNNEGSATRWKYAQDIEEAPDPKQEEKTKVEFTGSLCMGDFREKTMTFLIDGDIELNPGRYLITKID